MEKDYSLFRTHIEFIIYSDAIHPDVITRELNISIRIYQKNELSATRHLRPEIEKTSNAWALKTKRTDLEEETISHHIDYLKSILLPKIELIRKYKEDKRFDVLVYICVESELSGIGFDLSDDELAFLKNISNHIRFSVITWDSLMMENNEEGKILN